MRASIVLILLVVVALQDAVSQTTDSTTYSLPALIIQATRTAETETRAPRSVTVLSRPDPMLEPGLSLQRALRTMPGMWLRERGHYALGERLIIRGMGYRAAFGVRGVQAVLDGIPLTMPDGQSILDAADPLFVRRAELLRGPSAAFWGNGSGGVLFMDSKLPEDTAQIRFMAGSYGLLHGSAAASARMRSHQFQAHVSRVATDGYRHHSAGTFSRAGIQGLFFIGRNTTLRVVATAAILDADSPGSLTDGQAKANPRQSDARYVATEAGKSSNHFQGGVTLLSETVLGQLEVTVFEVLRRLENPLTFAYIDLHRQAGGMRIQLGDSWWKIGATIQGMEDARLNHNNEGGNPGRNLRLDQTEDVSNVGVSASVHGRLVGELNATTALRVDRIRFAMTDHFLSNGDQSGSRNFVAVSPSVGLSYKGFFANFGTAFETPTTTELINRPDGLGSFNPSLRPQQTLGLEIGTRGERRRLKYDIALYRLRVLDRLRPEQTADGTTYYSNHGRSNHQGLEVALLFAYRPAITVQFVYSLGRFRFAEEPLRGNRIPGIPAQHLQASVRKWWVNFVTEATFSAASAIWVDDANTANSPAFGSLDLYLGYQARVQPFVRLQNVFDSRHHTSVIVNAFGGRFFEPAQPRSLQGGATINY